MSLFSLKSTNSYNPRPTSRQNSDVPDEFYGVYGSAFQCTLPINSGSNTSRIMGTYFTGQDNAIHYSEPISWITPALKSGTFNGTWTSNIWSKLNTNPDFGLFYIKAALFVWNNNNTLQETIGTSSVSALSASDTEHTLSFGSHNITLQDGDRLYLECWTEAHDDTSGSGVNVTSRVWYNSLSYDSYISTPGTQTIFPIGGPKMSYIII